jgi:hypothetical protein
MLRKELSVASEYAASVPRFQGDWAPPDAYLRIVSTATVGKGFRRGGINES